MCPQSLLRGLLCGAVEATTTLVGSLAGFVAGGGGGALVAMATGGIGIPAVPAGAYGGLAAGAAGGLAVGRAISSVLFSENSGSGAGASDETVQDHRLTRGEIRRLQDGGVDPHDLKPNGRYDLFKDRDGNIIVKPRNGQGPGEATGLNIRKY